MAAISDFRSCDRRDNTDHCIGVNGDVSDTKSVPPQCQNAVPL
ncbi:unnamed protein product, partial [Staurois parvus]